jgi:hypothetical protein
MAIAAAGGSECGISAVDESVDQSHVVTARHPHVRLQQPLIDERRGRPDPARLFVLLVLPHSRGEIIHLNKRPGRDAIFLELAQQAGIAGPRHDSNPHDLILPRLSDN